MLGKFLEGGKRNFKSSECLGQLSVLPVQSFCISKTPEEVLIMKINVLISHTFRSTLDICVGKFYTPLSPFNFLVLS